MNYLHILPTPMDHNGEREKSRPQPQSQSQQHPQLTSNSNNYCFLLQVTKNNATINSVSVLSYVLFRRCDEG